MKANGVFFSFLCLQFNEEIINYHAFLHEHLCLLFCDSPLKLALNVARELSDQKFIAHID